MSRNVLKRIRRAKAKQKQNAVERQKNKQSPMGGKVKYKTDSEGNCIRITTYPNGDTLVEAVDGQVD